eukprot:3352226-Amphidinium_carterae.1
MATTRCADNTQSWRPDQGWTGHAPRFTGTDRQENRRSPTCPRQDNRLGEGAKQGLLDCLTTADARITGRFPSDLTTCHLHFENTQRLDLKHLARQPSLLSWIHRAIPISRWNRSTIHLQVMACQNRSLTTLLTLCQENRHQTDKG